MGRVFTMSGVALRFPIFLMAVLAWTMIAIPWRVVMTLLRVIWLPVVYATAAFSNHKEKLVRYLLVTIDNLCTDCETYSDMYGWLRNDSRGR